MWCAIGGTWWQKHIFTYSTFVSWSEFCGDGDGVDDVIFSGAANPLLWGPKTGDPPEKWSLCDGVFNKMFILCRNWCSIFPMFVVSCPKFSQLVPMLLLRLSLILPTLQFSPCLCSPFYVFLPLLTFPDFDEVMFSLGQDEKFSVTPWFLQLWSWKSVMYKY